MKGIWSYLERRNIYKVPRPCMYYHNKCLVYTLPADEKAAEAERTANAAAETECAVSLYDVVAMEHLWHAAVVWLTPSVTIRKWHPQEHPV